MKVLNVIRWIALPFVVFFASELSSNLIEWAIKLLDISFADVVYNNIIIYTFSNLTFGLVGVIVAYFTAPKAKTAVALIVCIIMALIVIITFSFIAFSSNSNNTNSDIPWLPTLVMLLSFIIGGGLGYLTVKHFNTNSNG